MPSVFLVSDTHFGHKGVCHFTQNDGVTKLRPWLEQHVGKQGRDWNWGMANMDATENRLTIKIRQKYAKYATIAAIQWS